MKDTSDVMGGACRMVKALGNRIAMEDPEDLLMLQQVQDTLDEAWATAVAGLRESGGYSDARIGQMLGITKQAVQQRFPRESSVDLATS